MESDDLEQLIRDYAVTMLNEATGGDWQYPELLSSLETIHEDDLMRVLHQAKVPLAAILREDLVRIFQAEEPEEPRYFISPARIVELYRSRHNILLPPQDDRRARFRHESHVLEALLVEKDQELPELENCGAALSRVSPRCCLSKRTEVFLQDAGVERPGQSRSSHGPLYMPKM